MKIGLIILPLFLFCNYFGQSTLVDYTMIGNESNEYSTDIDTLSGFLYLVGNTNECGSNDGFIIKYKEDSVYKRTMLGSESIDIIESVETTNTDTIFVGGFSNSNTDYDIYLAKLDTNLNIIESNVLKLESWNFCNDLAINGSNVLGVGKTHNGIDYDAFVFKVNSNLDTLWTKTIINLYDQDLSKVIAYNDSIYIACGYSELDGVGKEVYLISFNSNTGDTLWTKTIGGLNDDFCNSIIKTNDGGIAGFGTTSSYVSTSEDYMLFKVDSMGSFIWSELHQTQNGIGVYNDRGIDLVELQNGDLVVASFTESYGGPGVKSTMIMFTNSLGHWLNGYIYDGGNDDIPTAMIRVNDTSLYVVGIANSQTNGYSDAYLMRLRSINVHNTQNTILKPIQQVCFSNIENSIKTSTEVQIFPNPISSEFKISNLTYFPEKIIIYNLLGNIVCTIEGNKSNVYNIPLNIKNGNYLIKITLSETEVFKKVVVLR